MSHSGSDFYKPFVFVLGALVLLTIFLIFVANSLSPDSPDDPLAIAEMKRSIEPIGKSRVVEMAEPAEAASTTAKEAVESAVVVTETEAPAADENSESSTASTESAVENAESETETSGTAAVATAATATTAGSVAASMKVKAVVATNCAGCHNDGLRGAARSDDAAAWSALSEKGLDQLTASVINGKGKMPARAESTLNDDEIKQAVELMISNATGTTVSKAATATSVAATVTEASATTEMVAEVVSTGEAPAAVKKVVDTACAVCHTAGVANAPKFGDKNAWAPRLEKGKDALVASSIAGLGVMPPRGGTTLDDDQMRLAVEYMLSK